MRVSHRLVLLPVLVTGLLVGCATSDSGGRAGPTGAHDAGPDAPVSPAESPRSTVTPAAGLGTAIITVRDLTGAPRALIPVEIRTVGWPMPAALAIDIARMTNERGEYVWTDLPPGEYEVTARVPGADQHVSERMTVTAERRTPVVLTLG